jgi:hypothetical protein
MTATVRAKFPAGTLAVAAAGASATQSVTVVAGDLLIAHVEVSTNTDTGMTVAGTANGVANDGGSAHVHSNGQTAGFERFIHWRAPASGTYNVVATVSGGTPDAVGLKVYAIAGSDNSDPTYTSATGSGTALSVTSPTIASGGLGLAAFCSGSNLSGTGQTNELLDVSAPGGSSGANTMAGSSVAGIRRGTSP